MAIASVESIGALADSRFEAVRDIRRELHKIPEKGYHEYKTSALISDTLKNWNIPFRGGIAETGIIAEIVTDESYPTIALRADIDGLPIQEKTGLDFCSVHEGYMHACGHDMHTAGLLGTLSILNEIRNELPVNIRGIFQPAEESVPGGAQFMIKGGALENPVPEAIFGLHVDPFIPPGMVLLKDGPMMASTALFTITVKGKGGHAASPYKTVDPIPAAARIIEALQTIQSRMIDPMAPCVISVTKIQSGNVYNIVPETAEMCGTARTLDLETMKQIPVKMEAIIKGITEGIGAEYEFNYERGTSVLINDPGLNSFVTDIAVKYLGENAPGEYEGTFGGEDFADYLEHVPGCFFRLGCGTGSEKIPLHNPHFIPDEEALRFGMMMFTGIALNFGKEK